jgi:agmatinase
VIAILGVAFDGHSSFLRGAADGPAAIRAAFRSPSANSWSERGVDLGRPGLFRDAGDIREFGAIESAAAALLEQPLITLGGDHSITYPLLKAVRRRNPRLTILHIDAHADLYDEFEGSRLSHACPFARIMEEGLADRLVQVGLRTVTRHHREQAARFGVEMHEMKDWRGSFRFASDTPVYLSLDLDALDPAFAPGVAHHEPGGLSTREVLHLIQGVEAPLAAADIVELNPARDPSGITAMAAAKFFKEIAARMLG